VSGIRYRVLLSSLIPHPSYLTIILKEKLMGRKWLVPLDGSVLAERALVVAAELARREEGTLVLVRVLEDVSLVEQNPPVNVAALVEELDLLGREEVVRYFREVGQRDLLRGLEVAFVVESEHPSGVILDTAVSHHTDLIIISSHGHSGLTRWVLGSVTERVLRFAPCPVLVVRATTPMSHILITLDGSPLAEAALGPGMGLAQTLGAKVTLLRLAEGDGDVQGAYVYLAEVARRYEDTAVAGISLEALPAQGHVADLILAVAQDKGCECVVMSTHGRAGLTRWLYGSITEKVIRHLHDCNLLVVRPTSSS
jgi:nucleotide-binding universal stress UspA family protein